MLRRLMTMRSHMGAGTLTCGLHASSAGLSSTASPAKPSLRTMMASLVSRERITVTDPTWNRWKAVPGAFLIQLSIGGVYAWSIFNEPLTRNIGVVAASAQVSHCVRCTARPP